MFEIQPDLTKNLILNNISQQEIFEHFTGRPVVFNEIFCSPIRPDEHPTCTYKWIGGTLYYRDWSEEHPKDCFSLVQDIYGCNFKKALTLIKQHLLDEKELTIPNTTTNTTKGPQYQKTEKKKIQVKLCKFKVQNIDYLMQYGINAAQVNKFNVFSIDKLWLNEKLIWTHSEKDPALAYYFGLTETGEQRWKIYFYKRKEYRFIGNTNRINGWVQLPESGRDLIITKSLKDVMCLDRLGLPSIAMQNEVTIPYDYIIEELQQRFDNLYSFYDFDRTGVTNANKLKKIYNIPYIFLTNGKFKTHDYKAKDISDFIMEYSIREAEEFIRGCYDIRI